MKPDSFYMSSLLGRTFQLTFIFLLFFGGIAEWITRLDVFQAPLTSPTMGSNHYHLGNKLALLDADVRKNGPIDCIMMGSSMVDVGFDPDSFQKRYRELSGRDIRCFNFGIDSSSVISTAALAQIVMEDYHPPILILGTDARDYAIPSIEPGPVNILDSSWVKYRQGHFSVEGWLLEHSYLFRYRQHLSQLMQFNFKSTLRSYAPREFPFRPTGFNPDGRISTYINNPPDPLDTSYEVTYYKNIYSSYQMLDQNLAALERIMEYNKLGTQVIVVEMPVSDGLYYFFDNGDADYNRFIARVGDLANLHQVPFWRTEPLDSIPDNGWSDYNHMNVKGAEIFSIWLGEQVSRVEIPRDIEVFQP